MNSRRFPDPWSLPWDNFHFEIMLLKLLATCGLEPLTPENALLQTRLGKNSATGDVGFISDRCPKRHTVLTNSARLGDQAIFPARRFRLSAGCA